MVIIFLLLLSFPLMALEGNYSFSQELLEIRHQGNRNTCASFAAANLFRFHYYQDQGQLISPSVEHIVHLGHNNVVSDSLYLRELYHGMDAMAGFMATRALTSPLYQEEDWRYGERLSPVNDPIESQYQVVTIEREDIAEHLLQEQTPVIFNLMWYFDNFSDSGRGSLPTADQVERCHQHRERCGGHVILLVDYDPEQKLFLFANSYGEAWGENGYGELPLQWVLDHCEMCQYQEEQVHPELRDAFRGQALSL